MVETDSPSWRALFEERYGHPPLASDERARDTVHRTLERLLPFLGEPLASRLSDAIVADLDAEQVLER